MPWREQHTITSSAPTLSLLSCLPPKRIQLRHEDSTMPLPLLRLLIFLLNFLVSLILGLTLTSAGRFPLETKLILLVHSIHLSMAAFPSRSLTTSMMGQIALAAVAVAATSNTPIACIPQRVWRLPAGIVNFCSQVKLGIWPTSYLLQIGILNFATGFACYCWQRLRNLLIALPGVATFVCQGHCRGVLSFTKGLSCS